MYAEEMVAQKKIQSAEQFDTAGISVFLMTHWRYFGFTFNPITYYFIYRNKEIIGLVSEVHNTPWNEKYWYTTVIPTPFQPENNFSKSSADQEKEWFVDRKLKQMHVSPFMEMDYEYILHFTRPSDDFVVYWQMQKLSLEKPSFFASLRMRSEPVSQWNLIKVLIQYPFMTLRVVLGIYYQALLLWFKTTFFDHPKTKSQ
jgi:DUF1365 family protein